MITGAPWLTLALAKLGTREFPGAKSNPDIDEFHSKTAAGVPPQGDETSWCSSFVCWCFEMAGIRSTRNKAAISWVAWGEELQQPKPGCVVILKRYDPKNPNAAHVAFYLAPLFSKMLVLGGNQGNTVSIVPRKPDDVLGYRWPKEAA